MSKWLAALLLAAALISSGCATKKYVDEKTGPIAGLQTRVDGVEAQVEETQTRLDNQGQQIEEVSKSTQQASKTAQEALARAQEAGKLAQGKFLYEVALSEDKVRFAFNKADLNDEAKAALNEFAGAIKGENKNVYIEIQGHTDSIGTEKVNHDLGLRRAEAVRRYLNQEQGFALHRMSVISYGESSPVADNGNRDGRAQNRRVVLVVLE
jgi:outer membrane protein OmpA-like peptidoglycan-associated protein